MQLSQSNSIGISLENDRNGIFAHFNGMYVGRIYLNHESDRQHLQDPPPTALRISTTLVIEASQAARMPDGYQAAQNFVGGLVILPASDQAKDGKRQRSLSDATSPAKRVKAVAVDSSPVRAPSPSEYSRAIEQPIDMTKGESDSCITCIRGKRRCRGTNIQLVKGHKRCETCATPGTNTKGRVCYWKNEDRGVYTYEDAQRIMAKELGGRILTQNTRAGRLERQQRGESASTGVTSTMPEDVSYAIDPDLDSDTFHGDEDNEAVTVVHSDTDDTLHEELNGELASAVDSAYRSLYDTISGDLGVSDNDHSYTTSLLIDRAILEALSGGVHHDRVDGADENLLEHMRSRVQVYISTYEAIVKLSETGADQDEE